MGCTYYDKSDKLNYYVKWTQLCIRDGIIKWYCTILWIRWSSTRFKNSGTHCWNIQPGCSIHWLPTNLLSGLNWQNINNNCFIVISVTHDTQKLRCFVLFEILKQLHVLQKNILIYICKYIYFYFQNTFMSVFSKFVFRIIWQIIRIIKYVTD